MSKIDSRLKRKNRIRKKVHGTVERPRLSVFRSGKHIYAQVIDDRKGVTLAAASSLDEGLKGKQIHFALGFSHPVVFDLPEGVTAEVGKTPRTEDTLPTIDLTLRSANRELVGKTAVQIRALRPPEPYKGKGIKLHEEHVRRKEGKTGTA